MKGVRRPGVFRSRWGIRLGSHFPRRVVAGPLDAYNIDVDHLSAAEPAEAVTMTEKGIPITFHDEQTRLCPRLGGDVPFKYCRTKDDDLPCDHVLVCWWDRFDVADFIGRHLSAADIARLLGPQRRKLASLVKLIRQADQAVDACPNR